MTQTFPVTALGPAPDLTGYKTVFYEPFKTLDVYHPETNPTGQWSTVWWRAFDGVSYRGPDKKPMTLAQIDADAASCLRLRGPHFGGPDSLFTDAFMGPGFETATARGGTLRMVGKAIPDELKPQAYGRAYMAPMLCLTDGGKPRTFTYGYFEAGITMNVANGAHPAWWLMSAGSWALEIDIMEYLGQWSMQGPARDMYHTGIHINENADKAGLEIEGHAINGVYHKYGVLWTSDSLVFYLDRQEVRRVDGFVQSEPLFPILNLAIASPWAMQKYRGGGGLPDPKTFPMSMTVDQVLIMQAKA